LWHLVFWSQEAKQDFHFFQEKFARNLSVQSISKMQLREISAAEAVDNYVRKNTGLVNRSDAQQLLTQRGMQGV